MTRLTKGMYGHEFSFGEGVSKLFGLGCGQMRGQDYVHNGGWYNAQGEKLGWGDLSIEDVQNIRDGLEKGEAFIVLGEHDSFWEHVEQIGTIGSLSTVKPTEAAPGVDFVLSKARIVIMPGKVYLPTHKHSPSKDGDTKVVQYWRGEDGPTVEATYIDRAKLPQLLGVKANISE